MNPIVVVSFVAILIVLTYAVVLQQRQVNSLQHLVGEHLRLHVSATADADFDEHEVWPDGLLEVGSSFPARVDAGTSWLVVVIVRAGCGACDRVVAALPEVVRSLPSGYELKLTVGGDEEITPVDGVPLLRIASTDGVPTPALLLVAPDGTIQGKGPAADGSRITEFVEEGLRHGYGPPALIAASRPNVDGNDGHAGHGHAGHLTSGRRTAES